MKKSLLLTGIFALMAAFTSCSDDDSNNNNNNGGGNNNIVELTGTLSTRTLTKDKKYLLKGQVFVGNTTNNTNQTLTIEPGTVIMGDKTSRGTLIVTPGNKIIANGTVAEPIVFTSALPAGSRDRGDWGGLVILGRARVNQSNPSIEGISPQVNYGGDNDSDDSGTLRNVRVEFAGIELTPNNETNSITLGGVGNQTDIENCQVSFGGDDGFEWFGGTVNAKNLIAFATWDDSFDVDFGFSGKVQFGLEVRYPSFADQSGSNSFEIDNGPNDNETAFLTTGVFSNFTCVGPRAVNTQSINANFQHSIDLRRRAAATIANSVFVGYPRGIRMNQQTVYNNYNGGTGALLNNILVADLQTFSVGTGMTATATDLQTLWNAPANGNTTVTSLPAGGFPEIYSQLGFNTNIFFGTSLPSAYTANPTFAVTSGTLTTGASFTNSRLSSGFEQVAYRGAFGATDWTDGWAEFNPINKAY
ncbi:hypothetical protein CHU92_07380 [Flavobacterium cyanobacteriorum]|uniref:T9SS C-terminal target domain-containing protein n=1 Tax=Flavobacterium cyanobacteriorum TaxID=2022802 RepID=A0A255ZAF8_9FLAO|nr:hypothetical protein [Flavobacterium cyanobacteriorum]OYQ37855.1 hypothetical protein CHU92_07380 [Flavobacterium cyanobacteriorum]